MITGRNSDLEELLIKETLSGVARRGSSSNFYSDLPPLFPYGKTVPCTLFSVSYLFSGFSPSSCWQMIHGLLLIFINLVVIQTY